jgi:hypothetical protein
VVKMCTSCEDAGKDEVLATHTFYDPLNTMFWTCDKHAGELLALAHLEPTEWVGCKLVPTVEESDTERHDRYRRSNLLQFPLRSVA